MGSNRETLWLHNDQDSHVLQSRRTAMPYGCSHKERTYHLTRSDMHLPWLRGNYGIQDPLQFHRTSTPSLSFDSSRRFWWHHNHENFAYLFFAQYLKHHDPKPAWAKPPSTEHETTSSQTQFRDFSRISWALSESHMNHTHGKLFLYSLVNSSPLPHPLFTLYTRTLSNGSDLGHSYLYIPSQIIRSTTRKSRMQIQTYFPGPNMKQSRYHTTTPQYMTTA